MSSHILKQKLSWLDSCPTQPPRPDPVCLPAAILYEVLYNGVFKVDRSSLGVCQRVGRPNDLLSDDSMAACASSDESDVDAGDSRW